MNLENFNRHWRERRSRTSGRRWGCATIEVGGCSWRTHAHRDRAVHSGRGLRAGVGQQFRSATASNSESTRARRTARRCGSRPSSSPRPGTASIACIATRTDLVVFAYELAVERTPDGDQVRAIARPATTEFAARFPNADGGKPAPTLSATRESGLLSSGGRFAIEIPTDPGLRQTITDTVQIRINQRGAAAQTDEERQASASSAIRRAQGVDQRRSLVPEGGAGAIVAGRYAMFYIPGRGGYFFSADPVSGAHSCKSAKWMAHGCASRSMAATTNANRRRPSWCMSERGQIWVYHDPSYRPAGNWTKIDPRDETREQFFTAASDSLNWWLP